MKKMIVVIFLLLFILSSCTIKRYERSDEFNQYKATDIESIHQFHNFINNTTYESSIAAVKIEVNIFTRLGAFVERRTGSGIIFHQDSVNYHVLTLYDFTKTENNQMMTIEITDYMNRTYRAYLRRESEEIGLSGIRFSKNPNRLLSYLEIADQMPKIGEPLVLLGFQNRILNAITMGMLTNYIYDDQDEIISLETNIVSDSYGNGGAVLNVFSKIIGLQYSSTDGQTYLYTIDKLNQFKDFYLQP